MQLKLRFAEEDRKRPPDPPAWETLDAEARAEALRWLALVIARMLTVSRRRSPGPAGCRLPALVERVAGGEQP
ncbi:MAG: hypothetical protein EOR50_31590 [Mesorhizobium sp.]|uniref:hypothetical protein n=1 Tax=Mesorhizobium sp. TaxID=1871066 RepID=UPI000FE865C8|nr:hypothetical protein [Mesorhizobium sp.]RWK71859.1 MAG: hypothetical protein EOR50_31590 [Mesorhizobium sp.]